MKEKQKQRIILEQGTVYTLKEKIELMKRFNSYEVQVSDISGVDVFFKSEPLNRVKLNDDVFVEDSSAIELLEGSVDSFLSSLRCDSNFKFADESHVHANMKSNYMIYIKVDLESHMESARF